MMSPLPVLPFAEMASVMRETLPHLAGMVMVMLVLIMILGLCSVIRVLVKCFVGAGDREQPAAGLAPMGSPAMAEEPDEVPAEVTVVIAAAVSAVSGRATRVISIKPISPNWEKAGRQAVLTSHRIR